MDKIEKYLDQVCRSIGGPRELRQHVRQELREHLLDAIAQHKSAGLPQERAIEQALEDFGGPEQVRAELEAAHGHRGMAIVIDKAIEWKEKTMKAKWLWTSWAYLALVGVIVLEFLFISFNVVMIMPKFRVLLREGLVDPAILNEPGVAWMPAFLNHLTYVGEHYTTWIVLAIVAVWGLFEWRVRSENKPFMRLAALGTGALGLLAIVILTTGSLVLSFILGLPAVGRIAKPFALEQVAKIETSVTALEGALAKQDWAAMHKPFEQSQTALANLTKMSPVVPALTTRYEEPTADDLRAQLTIADSALIEAQGAIQDRDAARLQRALTRFQEAMAPVVKAAKKRAQ